MVGVELVWVLVWVSVGEEKEVSKEKKKLL